MNCTERYISRFENSPTKQAAAHTPAQDPLDRSQANGGGSRGTDQAAGGAPTRGPGGGGGLKSGPKVAGGKKAFPKQVIVAPAWFTQGRDLISCKVFMQAFCKSKFSHKSVNLSFIITYIKRGGTHKP